MRRQDLTVGDEVMVRFAGASRACVCEITALEPSSAFWPTSVRVMSPWGEAYVSLRGVLRKTELNSVKV